MKKVFLSVPLPNYLAALARAGAEIVDTPARAELLLLPGGGDIAPWRYGRPEVGASDIDPTRDERELALLREFVQSGRPVLGICRGLQLVNVFFGGTLHRHIDGHSQCEGRDRLHPVFAEGGTLRALYGARFTVNSAHHQAVEWLGDGLRVLARAEDGTIEALAHEDLPILAVQWHPERLHGEVSVPKIADGAAIFALFCGNVKK